MQLSYNYFTIIAAVCEKKDDVDINWRLEHLLRYLRALPTIRVYPELDGRTLDIVHSLN